MVTHHRYAEVNGRRIFYREAGPPAAPAVVLLHGTPASSHQYRNLIPALADRYHVIAPDYPGFGHSDVPGVDEFKYTFDTVADHVDALLDQLGLQRYAIYVQDYGAPVGWRLALRHPERIAAIISQNGNAYVEGFVGDAMEPLFAYGRDRSEANADALRALISPDGLKWQFTHGVSDPSVVDPDSWINAHAAVASTPERVAAQLELFADYSSNVDLYPRVHEYFPYLAGAASGGVGPQRPDLRAGRRVGVRSRFAKCRDQPARRRPLPVGEPAGRSGGADQAVP